jgi:hypothetical protein
MLKEKFNSINSAKLLWGLGKFFNRNLTPLYNQEIAGTIVNRYELSKVASVNHRIHRRVVQEIIK